MGACAFLCVASVFCVCLCISMQNGKIYHIKKLIGKNAKFVGGSSNAEPNGIDLAEMTTPKNKRKRSLITGFDYTRRCRQRLKGLGADKCKRQN